jgi:glycosyltransferase involved in cell wall biosynthesis
MRLLYIADGRSPTARNWIAGFVTGEHEVHLISTSPCNGIPGLTSLQVLPVAFSGAGLTAQSAATARPGRLPGLRQAAPMWLRTFIRQWLGPLTLPATARQLRPMIAAIQPDLVHAMRYPYEGILAAQADPAAPLLVSVWGNDFTLHARSNPLLGSATRRALRRTDALHTDCQRDLRLARQMGFAQEKPAVVLPGSGGVREALFYPPESPRSEQPPVIINPRGFRTYIRNDSYFQAIPLVLEHSPQARFISPAAAHELEAQRWVKEFGLEHAVELLSVVPQGRMAELFRQAHLVVSPSTHDGTPNTILEAMACGCFPVAGRIESVQEWLTDGENSLLFDPNSPRSIADAILKALSSPGLRQRAAEANLAMIRERANYQAVMAQAAAFYQQVVNL